ncbi:DMT family transporter [Microvirga guangxiensis]|uniref:EamA-like transporter family protein n=1 Tax=Microvirga guangxiensis TaxID=549386 RepID=A0A1G5JK21_9HYPH|nr:DMT family transporter [Microvirga guangxiensis]SCY88733.1 EamA-like transporter family protein [Microvirga guangxiensis]
MTQAAATMSAQDAKRFDGTTFGLYAATVLLWGVSWIGIRAQLGVVAPEMSVLWRFLLSAVLMWGWVLATGHQVRFPLADHLRFAAVGCCLFSFNFISFYYGGLSVPSGLLSVVFSLASVFNLVLGFVIFRQKVEPRVALGGVIGVAGIGLLFWPEITGAGFNAAALKGLGLCVMGTLFFCSGNMISTVVQRRGAPLLSATAWGMTYGCVVLLTLNVVRGNAFIIEPTMKYIGSLLYLSIGASVLAFMAYLTLLRRLGAARAGYTTVLFPIIALAVSTLLESYQWTALAGIGVVFALVGNVLVLRKPSAK